MSAERGSAPDLDLLADYAAGVLDGTEEGARVAARIAEDPDWAALHAALVRAEAAVSADLVAWTAEAPPGETPHPVPGDVAARLDQALADAGLADAAGAPRATAETATTATVIPLTARRGRRLRWALGGAAAASVAVLAVGGVGVTVLQGMSNRNEGGAVGSGAYESDPGPLSADGGSALPTTPRGLEPEGPGEPTSPVGTPTLVASGNDYARARLGAARGPLARVLARTTTAARTAPLRVDQVPAGLAPLTEPVLLSRCLRALAAEQPAAAAPRAPATLVDYARFEGRDALVVVRPAAGGRLEAVVAGPGCGRTGSDELFRTPLSR